MNLYIRYFDEECVVSSAEEAFDFLSSLPGITLDEAFVKDLRQYMDSPMPYPKRYKVRPRVYFIVIKTTATTLAEFKVNGGRSLWPKVRRRNPRPVFPSTTVRDGMKGKSFSNVWFPFPAPRSSSIRIRGSRLVARLVTRRNVTIA